VKRQSVVRPRGGTSEALFFLTKTARSNRANVGNTLLITNNRGIVGKHSIKMDGPTAVTDAFPEHEFVVRRIFASDAEFRTLCEDYSLATSALDRWKDNQEKSEQYRLVIHELEEEILEFIEGRHPRQMRRP
jgi:hypothetical protein